MGLWKKIKKLLNINVTETVKESANAGRNVLLLAKAIKENEKDLTPFITNVDSLLDILNSPFAQAIAPGLPLIGIAAGILKYVVEKTREEPSLETSVALVSQSAYLASLQDFFAQHPQYKERLNDKRASDKVKQKISKLDEIELTDKEARETLVCFHDSPLAKKFNQVLQARLQESGLAETEAQRVTERISRHTHRYLMEIVADLKDKVTNLVGSYSNDYWNKAEVYSSIDKYLADVIAKKPLEKVFDEEFCFQDIYVPLEVNPVKNGEVDKDAKAQNMETWAEKTLLSDNKVLFIQGGPGRGKSVFCRMFADWVRRELHPIYTPILIRLRDVITFEKNFDKTLAAAIGTDFVTSDSGWLTDRNTRFLFLLDGFDELLLERGASTELKQFLEQVEGFQRRCNQNSERGHRVLITGRPLALYGIERDMPINLARVEIVLMSQTIQERWFGKWTAILNQYYADLSANLTKQFREFITHEDCPQEVKTLAQEPLLLYLLASMHRYGKFNLNMFESATAGNAKVLIYETVVEWVLEKQRCDFDSGENINPKMTGLDPDDLRSVLAETALCVVQLGGEYAPIKMIEKRLLAKEDEGAIKLIQTARDDNRDDGLKNALAAFYIKSVADKKNINNSVEFSHKSFGEFLCAERIVESFAEWTEKTGKRRKNYVISTKELEWQIYDLFGYGFLTPEIVEYIGALWEKADDIDFFVLFERLNDFYLRWSDGEFIDSTEDTLPQKKAREMFRGQRRVDVYTGLNILILLFELHRFGQEQEELKEKINFHPCGNPDDEEEINKNTFNLLGIIGYSYSTGVATFISHLGNFLSGTNLSKVNLGDEFLYQVNLSNANLSEAHLSNTNLSEANLSKADLSNTNLSEANLSKADLSNTNLSEADLSKADLSNTNLSEADLSKADLSNTNLSEADLSNTNLSEADLSKADLSNTNLSEADLSKADLSNTNLSEADLSNTNLSEADLSNTNLIDMKWDSNTNWSNARGLHKAREIPEALKQESNFAAAVILCRGGSLAQEGKIDEAITAYNEAQVINPNLEISFKFWGRLCIYGCQENRAADVLFAGEKAVELEPDDGACLATRGLARALTGNLEGAMEDFQAALEDKVLDDDEKQQLQGWLEVLRRGENPITEEVLASLR